MRLRQTFSAIMTMTLEILFTLRRLSVTEASSNDTGVYTCTGPTVGFLIFGDDMFNDIGNDIGSDIGNDIGNDIGDDVFNDIGNDNGDDNGDDTGVHT